MKTQALARKQLDKSLGRYRSLSLLAKPPKGLIRAIRDVMGMSARQLAERLGVRQQRVAMMEKEEMTGALTIKSLQRVAEALDCVLVWSFVPKTSLEQTVRKQAEKVARQRWMRAHQTMALENQSLGSRENREVLRELIDQLTEERSSRLWDRLS